MSLIKLVFNRFSKLASTVYKFFDKRSSWSGAGALLANKSAAEPNYELANQPHGQIIRKLKKRENYSSFRGNIWGLVLADMLSLSKYNKGIKYLLWAIDLFCKYARVVLWKDKKRITIVNAFQKIISKGRKSNKICVYKGGEFWNNLFKRLLEIKNIDMYSKCNEGKSVVAEIFISTLKKHMAAVSKNVYFDVLDDVVNKYNNTVHITMKIKPIYVASDSYAEFNEDSNEKDPNFKVGDHVRISKYKNIFGKGYTQNWSEKVFAISKIKNTVMWTLLLVI